MKKIIRLLATALIGMAGFSSQAANLKLYYDTDGFTPGGGVANGATYTWNKTDVFWNDIKNGDDQGGLGTLYSWPDAADLGYTEDNLASAAFDARWGIFSAGGSNFAYTVSIPNGEMRDCYRLELYRDQVTLSGALRFLDPGTYAAGFMAENPGVLILSNLTVVATNAPLLRFMDGSTPGYNARFRIGTNVTFGGKALFINGYSVLDFSELPDIGVIWTTNNPDGVAITSVQFHNYGDNNILQGRGSITVPLGSWAVSTNGPHIGWRPDGYGNAQGGGFSAKGGKLTVNLFGDGRTVNWYRPELDGNAPTTENTFCGGNNSQVFNLLLGGYETDSEVEFQNGIDFRGGKCRIKVLTPATTDGYATISGPLVNSLGTGVVYKVSQLASGIEQGAGRLYLTGTNTYTAPTIVGAGALLVTPNHVGGGAITVTNGATFGVKLTQSGTVPTANLTLGQSGGGEGNLEFDYAVASTVPALWATNFTVNGTNLTTITVKGTLALGQIPLVKYGGAIGGNGFAGLTLGTLPAGVSATLVDNAGNQSVDLNVTAVPTPSTITIDGITVSGNAVTIDFTAGAGDAAGSFTLQRSGTVGAGYVDDPGASITGTAPSFQATTTTSGDALFYRVRR